MSKLIVITLLCPNRANTCNTKYEGTGPSDKKVLCRTKCMIYKKINHLTLWSKVKVTVLSILHATLCHVLIHIYNQNES